MLVAVLTRGISCAQSPMLILLHGHQH